MPSYETLTLGTIQMLLSFIFTILFKVSQNNRNSLKFLSNAFELPILRNNTMQLFLKKISK